MAILKIGDTEYGSLDNPIQGLLLMKEVIKQYMGPTWTTFNPHCPLCNTALQDFAKNMHRAVGSCSNTSCGAEIHTYDYLGKMMDIIRLVESQYGPLEEISKKKLAIEEPKKSGKNKGGGKGKGKGQQQHSHSTTKPKVPATEEGELIFEY